MIKVETLPANMVKFDGTQRTVYQFKQLGRPMYAARTEIGRVVSHEPSINAFVKRIKAIGGGLGRGLRS